MEELESTRVKLVTKTSSGKDDKINQSRMGVSAFALPPHSDLTMHRVSIAGEILLKGAKFLEFFFTTTARVY